MSYMNILIIILIFAVIFGAIILGLLFLRLKKMIDSVTIAICDVRDKLAPTLEHIDQLTDDLKPAAKKVDPLMDRVNLTVDEVNLELMRVDQIMNDISNVTATASNAADAVDTMTGAPAKLVNTVSDRLYQALNGKKSSATSTALADAADDRESNVE